MKHTYEVNLTQEQEARVKRLHQKSFIFDALTTSILDVEYAKKLRSVGINATNYTVASTDLFNGKVIQDNFVSTCKKIGHWIRVLEKCHEFASLTTNLEEMHKIVDSGKIAIFFGFQNGSPIEDNLDYLDIFYRLGVRFIQLTYNARNYIGNGCGEANDSGLSSFGEKVITRMNELGIVVDLSHCGYQTTMDAIKCSKKPALITHANVKALADTPRNKTDEQISAMAERGGVIGVKHMLGDTKTKLAQDTTVADLVDHIDYIVQLVGIDHVAIGTDFTGTTDRSVLERANKNVELIRSQFSGPYVGKRFKPAGIASISGLPNMTRALVLRGYTDTDIKKILGENWLRVLKDIFNH